MDHETDCDSLGQCVDQGCCPCHLSLPVYGFLGWGRFYSPGIGECDTCSITVQYTCTGSSFGMQWEHRLEN